jgi:hypothetical protein
MDPATEKWEFYKREIIPLFKQPGEHELLGG